MLHPFTLKHFILLLGYGTKLGTHLATTVNNYVRANEMKHADRCLRPNLIKPRTHTAAFEYKRSTYARYSCRRQQKEILYKGIQYRININGGGNSHFQIIVETSSDSLECIISV